MSSPYPSVSGKQIRRIYLTTGWQFNRNFVWIVNAGYDQNEIRFGKSNATPSTHELFDDPNAPGLANALDYIRFGTQLFLDHRDEPGNPHDGFMAAFSFDRFDDRNETAFDFNRYGLDVRSYMPLGSPQRVLALRAGIQINEANDGNHVPFFMQPSLGGSHTLRGFDSFRRRGERVMLYQEEYRWEATTFWDLNAFIDTGAVSGPDENLSFSNLQWDWGFGTRFKTYRDIVLRLEVAFSDETTRYYFRGSTSF